MKIKQWSKRMAAYLIAMSMCFSLFGVSGEAVQAGANTGNKEGGVTLSAPVIDADKGMVIWDCVYFGNYWQSKYVPQPANRPEQGENDVERIDADGTKYLVRKDKTCYKYEPVKWRILSINQDGTDAFLMADQVLDIAQYYSDSYVEVTWEKSDIRTWINETFIGTAFTAAEQAAIKETVVTTADNPWSKEPGGNNTKDRVYLASLEEVLNPAYGFSSDVTEGKTRKITFTDYVNGGGAPSKPIAGSLSYWLRSPGTGKGCPAQVGHWGEGEILIEPSLMLERSAAYLGVRPVMHVNLSNRALWTYAGKMTLEGVVLPKEDKKEPPKKTQTKVKKPAKPVIKKLTNKKGRKVVVKLSKKVSGAAGYQVAYATKSSMKGQKKKTFKGTSVTLKGLKKNKTYYFRVRAYKKQNKKTVYGNWGNKKRIKVKK